jgi:beta-galactosidase
MMVLSLACVSQVQVAPRFSRRSPQRGLTGKIPRYSPSAREPARATAFAFESREKVLGEDPSQSIRFLSLNGDWRFSLSPNADELPARFEDPSYDVSAWKHIKVPADWQAEGFDQPRYNNITYPFPANRPLISHETNPVGSYRRYVDIPAKWQGQDVILHIGGAGSPTTSGSMARSWLIPRTASHRQSLTSHDLKPGRNTVAIQVYRWSDGSDPEDQDFWRVSGIERDGKQLAGIARLIATRAQRSQLHCLRIGIRQFAVAPNDADGSFATA